MNHDRTERPLPALVGDLTRDVVDLIRKEIALARAELRQKMSDAQSGISAIAMGAAVAMAGLVIVFLAAANALAMALPPEQAPWLAPLIVGAIALLVGYLVLRSGQSRLSAENLVPERTVNSLRADRAVVESHTVGNARADATERAVHRDAVKEKTHERT